MASAPTGSEAHGASVPTWPVCTKVVPHTATKPKNPTLTRRSAPPAVRTIRQSTMPRMSAPTLPSAGGHDEANGSAETNGSNGHDANDKFFS